MIWWWIALVIVIIVIVIILFFVFSGKSNDQETQRCKNQVLERTNHNLNLLNETWNRYGYLNNIYVNNIVQNSEEERSLDSSIRATIDEIGRGVDVIQGGDNGEKIKSHLNTYQDALSVILKSHKERKPNKEKMNEIDNIHSNLAETLSTKLGNFMDKNLLVKSFHNFTKSLIIRVEKLIAKAYDESVKAMESSLFEISHISSLYNSSVISKIIQNKPTAPV